MAEPPYGIIWNRMKTGKVVPFLGAGASMIGRIPGVPWEADHPRFLPSGQDLSHLLAREANFPSQEAQDLDDLAKVASYYAVISGRPSLRERLHELLTHDFNFGGLHAYLASIPSPLLIVSTNYDTLIEQAFHAANKPYDLVIHPTDHKEYANAVWWWPHGALKPTAISPNELVIDLDKTTVIYKMHGNVHRESDQWDSFVITEEDYVDFLSRMTSNTAVPPIFYEHLRIRSFLFLGYSLRDWNLRIVLKNLDRYLTRDRMEEEDRLPSWSIQRKPSELECKLWEKRNVNIFNMELDDFVTGMQQWTR